MFDLYFAIKDESSLDATTAVSEGDDDDDADFAWKTESIIHAAIENDGNNTTTSDDNEERDQSIPVAMVDDLLNIRPPKENFIVAFLNAATVPEDATAKEATEISECVEAMMQLATGGVGVGSGGRKRDSNGNILDTRSTRGFFWSGRRPRQAIANDDDDENLDCKLFGNNKQTFLELCRVNHYQFDELRRAKHTSMMILWQLHNPNEPKYGLQCSQCKQRFKKHQNDLLQIRRMEHANWCISGNSSSCNSILCSGMKQCLMHAKMCRKKVAGGCKRCRRTWTLLRNHAEKCNDKDCSFPRCMTIRKKMPLVVLKQLTTTRATIGI